MRVMRSPRRPYLAYHQLETNGGFDRSDPGFVHYIVGLRDFVAQMDWLRKSGISGMNVSTALHRDHADVKGVALTFDDGYDDFLRYALPVLQRYGFSATSFVIAGRLGGVNSWDARGPRKPLMTAAQVRAAMAAGIEIGSHGLRHVTLNYAADPALIREQRLSRQILQDVTGSAIGGFCYPYGHLNGRVVDGVHDAGYDYACAIWGSELTGQYAVPRMYVGDADGPARLRAKWLRHRLTSANVKAADIHEAELRRTA